MNRTKIPWTDLTWEPAIGCSPVSESCSQCYASRLASTRLKRFPNYAGLAQDGRWSGKVKLLPEKLDEPWRRRKPARIFVCSMSDLFHEDVPESFIDEVLRIMLLSQQHTFMILTKREKRMCKYFTDLQQNRDGKTFRLLTAPNYPQIHGHILNFRKEIPLPNIWLGVTAENQARADERIPLLLNTPAAKRFVSYEPALGPVDFEKKLGSADESNRTINGWHGLDWVVCGGESGPGARECREEWVQSVYDQCQAAGVPFFFKNYGADWRDKDYDTSLDSEGKWMKRRAWPA